jgi:hypothetical protein
LMALDGTWKMSLIHQQTWRSLAAILAPAGTVPFPRFRGSTW